jgi:hypothetical protein
MMSSIGIALLGRPLGNPGPKANSQHPARANGVRRCYAWWQYVLRYRLGACLPPVGPQAFFVCAAPDGAPPWQTSAAGRLRPDLAS